MRRLGPIMVACVLTLGFLSSLSAAPPSITQQGRLLNDDGSPMSGSTTLNFAFYDAATGGAIVWESEETVDLGDQGFYSVVLGGSSNPLDESILDGETVWMGLSVNGGEELSPRLEVTSVPYAISAGHALSVADGSVGADALASGAIRAASLAPGSVTSTALATGAVTSDKIASVDWSSVTNVPASIADGDDDTLGGISCNAGDVASYDGAQWTCASLPAAINPDSFADSAQSCPAGQGAVGFDSTGGLICSATVSTDQNCPAGQAVSGLGTNGDVVCVDAGDRWTQGGTAGAIISGFTVSARSTCGQIAPFPNMEVYANHELVASFDVQNSSFADYQVNLSGPTYVYEITTVFTNNNNNGGCDHNLYVEHILLDTGELISATQTDRVIYDRNDWLDLDDVLAGQTDLNWTGGLRFFLAPKPQHRNRIWWTTGFSDWRHNDGLDPDNTWLNVPGRQLTFTKSHPGSVLKISYTDTLGTNYTSYDGCRWRIQVDGNSVLSFSAADTQPNGGWTMQHGTHTAIVPNLAEGSHTVTIQNWRRGNATECLTGWNTSGNNLIVEEIL